jgi:hypothetical protein
MLDAVCFSLAVYNIRTFWEESSRSWRTLLRLAQSGLERDYPRFCGIPFSRVFVLYFYPLKLTRLHSPYHFSPNLTPRTTAPGSLLGSTHAMTRPPTTTSTRSAPHPHPPQIPTKIKADASIAPKPRTSSPPAPTRSTSRSSRSRARSTTLSARTTGRRAVCARSRSGLRARIGRARAEAGSSQGRSARRCDAR